MAPPPRPRRRPLLGNIPDPEELGIPLDLEAALEQLRAQPIVEDPYQLLLPQRPKPPAPKPPEPGYLDTLMRQVRGEAPTAGALTGAAGGAAAVGADPEGRRRGILERAFAAADEGAFTGGPVEKGVGRYEKEHEDFNRSLEVGARVAREKGGEEAAEQYVYNLHRNQFGGRVADALKASRDHSRRRLAEGSPAEQAAAEGEELARRHLENLKRAAEAGELGEEADTAQRAIDMLSENLGSPKGLARLAVTTGLPMLATAAGTILGTPVIGAGAGVAARTAATRLWRERVEGQAPDPMVDLTAGVTELLDVPGIAGLRAAGGAITNPLLRTAALTAGGAISEGAQESAQAVTEGLLQSGSIPRGLDIASQGLAGALVGGALGPLVGGEPGPGQAPGPGTTATTPGGAAVAPPGAPPAPSMPPDIAEYLGSLGYDVSGGPDSWVLALEQALENGEQDVADILTQAIDQLPTVQAAKAAREREGSTTPRVAAAVEEAAADLRTRIGEALRTGQLDQVLELEDELGRLLQPQAPPAAPPEAAPAPAPAAPPGAPPGPAPGAAPGAPPAPGPITVTPVPGTVAGATPEEAVTAGAPAATQDLLDQARGEGSELPPEAGVGIVGGDIRGAGAGGVTTPVVPTGAPPAAPSPGGIAAPPPPAAPPVVAPPPASASLPPAPSTAPAPAAGPAVSDILRTLIRGAQTQEEAGALLSVAGRIQAAFGNNPAPDALEQLRAAAGPEAPLTPAEEDALTAFQLALSGGLPGPEPTQEEVDANIPNAPSATAPAPETPAPAEGAAPTAAPGGEGLDQVEATGQRGGALPRPAPAPTAAPPATAPPAGTVDLNDDREEMRKRSEAAQEKELERRRNSEQFKVGDVVYTKSGRPGTVIAEKDQLLDVETEDYRGRRRVERVPNYNLTREPPATAPTEGGPTTVELQDAAIAKAVEELEARLDAKTAADREMRRFLVEDNLARAEALGATAEQTDPVRRSLEEVEAAEGPPEPVDEVSVFPDENAEEPPPGWVSILTRRKPDGSRVESFAGPNGLAVDVTIGPEGEISVDGEPHDSLEAALAAAEGGEPVEAPPEGAAPDNEDATEFALGPRSAAALERWLKARKVVPDSEQGKELTRLVTRHREVVRKLHAAEALVESIKLAKPLSIRGAKAVLKRRLQAAKLALKVETDNYEASTKALRQAVAAIPDAPWRSLIQIADGRLPEPRQARGPAGALLPRTLEFLRGLADAPIDHPINFDTLEARTVEYAKTAVVSEPAILSNLERAVAATNPNDWAKLFAAGLQGVGDKTIREALTTGASHPAWKRIVAHLTRSLAERRAIEEALAEDGWPIAGGDLAGHIGTVAAAMGAEIDALPSTADPELPWGLTDTATGQPVRARAAHAAMTSRTGRLYARIVQALEDSLGGETVDQADEVPFDIPEGNPDDIPPFEVGEDSTEGFLRVNSVARAVRGASERLLEILGFRTEDDPLPARPSILNMPLGKPLIRAAQQTLDFGPPRVHTPVREPRTAAGGQPLPAGPGAGGRGGAATGRAEPPDAGVRGPGAGAPVGGAGASGGGGAPQPTGGVVPTVQRGNDIFKIVTIRPNFTLELPVRRDLVPARLLQHLDDHQQIGVARAIEAMSSDQRGFLLADGTGVGKTREILATAEHFAKQGRSVLIVAPAAVLNIPKSGEGKGQATGSYADDSRTMGVPYEQIRLTGKTDKGPELRAGKVYLTHYESFFYKNQVDDNTVVIFDEAHNIKNPPDMSRRGGEGQKFAAKAHAVMFATATPGDQAHHLMYAQRIGLLEGRDERQFLADMGMVQQTRMGKDGQAFTVWKARDETVMRRAIKELYGRMTKAGKMIRREVDFSPVEVEFRDLTVSEERLAEIEKIRGAFPTESSFDTRMYLMHARRQLEPDKVRATLDIMDRELSAGRSVVIFAQRLNRSDVIKRTKYRDETGQAQVLEELITSSEGTIKTLREALAARGITYAEITGDFAGRKDDQIQLFQSGKARVAIATVEGGGTGINLDDRLGTRPRTLIMMTAPLESTVYIQAIGRVHRKPTKSISRVIGLFSEHEVDTWNKQIIADKLQLQGAQVAGSVTRLDPTKGGDVDVDFGEDIEVLRPGTRRKPTDDGKTKPAASVDLSTALSWLKNLVTWNGRYQNPKRLTKESAYRIHRRAVERDLGGVIDVGGEWFIETKDGWVIRGRLTHPNERMGTYGTFSFDEGTQQGVPSNFGVETDDPEIRLVRDVDKLIETVADYKTWRNFHRDHRAVLDKLFGVDAPLFARLLGATSQRAGVETNITLALRAYEQLRMGLPFQGFQHQVAGNLEAIRQDEAISGSKVSPYTRALLGDEDATWVDRHIARLVLGREALGGEGQDKVSPRQERLVRAALRQAAEELGWTPAQMSSASWVAGQVLEGGVKEENVRDYARSLQARASAIRRFYDYFGPVAGPGGRAVSAVAAAPSDPRNLGFGTAEGDPEPEHRVTVPTQVEGAQAVANALQPLPQPHAVSIGTGFTAQDDESWNLWWTALSANFADGAGRWTIRWSDYAGMDVSTPSHIASIANIARNVAVEQSSVVLVKGGKLHGSLLSGSGTPGGTQPLPEGWTLSDLQTLMRQTGSNGYYLVHNHPDGVARPSRGDLLATAQIAAGVPGFMGHVVVNHGTYQIITPAKVHAIVVGQRRSATFGERALMNVFDQLQDEFAHSVGAARQPDPLLAQGINPEEYWRSEQYRVKGVDPLVQKFNGLLQSLSRGSKTAKWPLIVLVDNRWRLRAVTSVNPEIYFNKEAFKTWLESRKREFGAHNAFVAIEQKVGGTQVVGLGAPEGWGESNQTATFDDTTRDYVWTSLLMGAVDPEAAAAQKSKATIENTIGTRFDLRAFRFGVEPQPMRPPGDNPNDPAWRRRVDFADARARAGGRWTVARLTDAFIAGVDRFLRGLKDFGRWAASMNYAGLGPYLRAMWTRLEEMFRPRAYTVEGRPRSLADQPIEDMIPGPGGRTVIRPIPRVRQQDLEAALDRVAEGRREIPRIAPARTPTGQPGERPPAPPGSPINLDRIEDQDDVKNLMRQVMEALRGRMQQVKSYRSWAEAQERAEAAGLTEQDVARLLREKGVLTDVEIEAIRMLRQEAMVDAAQKLAYVQDVQARLATAPDAERAALEEELLEAQRNYRAAMHRGIGIMFTTVAAGSEAGRALAIHRRFIESLSPGERFMRRMLRGVPEDERLSRELADAILRNDMQAVMRLYHRVHKPTFWGYFNEYFINSILSGPATLVANIAGNVTHELLLRTPERGISTFLEERGIRAMLERFFGVAEPDGPQRVSGEMREAAKALFKLRLGFPDMLREARLALTEENIPLYSQGDWSPPAWPGRLGTIIRTPGRLMKALDVASKKAAAAAERAAQVYRMAVADVRSGRVQESELTNRALEIDEQLQTWLELDRQRQVNPRLLTAEDRNFLVRNRHLAAVVKAMVAAADKSTFQDDVLPLTHMLMTARARHPWLTPFVPFIKTPERIIVGAVKRTPLGLVQALNAMRAGKMKGAEASDRIAQGVLGTAAGLFFYEMALKGLITGGGPADPKERQVWLATGKLPYAIKVGSTWYSMARIEPLATILGFAADLAEAKDAKTQGDAWDKLHYSLLNNITNKTYLEGMINAAEALSDPDRYGAQFSKRMVGALVPNLLASAARAIDPTIRQTDDISSTIMARLPILSEALPAKLTGTGEPRLRQETMLSRFVSPIRYSEEGGPERNLERLFLETGYSPSAPPRAVRLPGSGGREFMLSPEERQIYGDYARRATTFARELARNGDWTRLDVYQKEEVLKRIYRFAHDSARRDIYRSVYRRAWAGTAEEKAK